jgi:hypothetical protein
MNRAAPSRVEGIWTSNSEKAARFSFAERLGIADGGAVALPSENAGDSGCRMEWADPPWR